MRDTDTTAFGVSPPDPELQRLEPNNVSGRTTFEWLPGGFFLQQRIELDFAGFEVQGLELIGYDPASGTYPSTVFSNVAGTPLPYRWELEGDELKITTEVLGATFRGKWSEDRTSRADGRAKPRSGCVKGSTPAFGASTRAGDRSRITRDAEQEAISRRLASESLEGSPT
jgi:hypothetical protein